MTPLLFVKKKPQSSKQLKEGGYAREGDRDQLGPKQAKMVHDHASEDLSGYGCRVHRSIIKILHIRIQIRSIVIAIQPPSPLVIRRRQLPNPPKFTSPTINETRAIPPVTCPYLS